MQKSKTKTFSLQLSPSLRFAKKKYAIISIFLLTIFLVCLFITRATSDNTPPDDISLFLENIMIREGGLYTLVGSKPMTTFRVYPEIPDSPPSINSSIVDNISQKEQDDSFYYLSTLKHLKHDKLWNTWTKLQQIPSSQAYIITTRTSNYSDRLMGIFINIPNAIYTLSSNIEIFEKETGMTFQPKEILSEIGSDSSEFWKKVFGNHYLLGILLGYGNQNAFIFNWIVSLPNESQDVPFKRQNEDYRKSGKIRYNKKIKIQDLILPQFYYFDTYSEQVEKYKSERKAIIKEFKGKYFKSKVLKYLKTEHLYDFDEVPGYSSPKG